MDDEKRIVVKYKLNPEVMKVGASENYDHRQKVRKWIKLVAGVWFVSLFGLFVYIQIDSKSSKILPIVLLIIGISCFFNKYFYVRRTVKSVFAGREKEINAQFAVKEDGFFIKTDDTEGSSLWTGLINYHFSDKGALLYPQKNIYYFIPKNGSEISGGTWDEFTEMIQRNVEVTTK